MATTARELLARRLKALRLQRGWSQRDLMQASGVSQKTISNIEQAGKLDSNFTFASAEQLAQAFEYQVWQLLIPYGIELEADEFKQLVTGVDQLLKNYAEANREGRQIIERIAEREAQYVRP